VLMGEPVGSCTDFVAAVANPIKINYREAFVFAPFSTLVDPDRVRELLLGESQTSFPEEVAYLFGKQIEEADLVVLNKIDQIDSNEATRLTGLIQARFPTKQVLPVSARRGDGMEAWLELLISGQPGAGTVLAQIDYDRYARAEAVLGWLNAAVRVSAPQPFQPAELLNQLILRIRDGLKVPQANIGHLKLALSSQGRTMWANLTQLNAEPSLGENHLAPLASATLLVNARVQIQPKQLESQVREALNSVAAEMGLNVEVLDLQCFSPSYPNPPYLVR
jgi:hypothetical protein